MKLNSHNEWNRLKEIIVGNSKESTTVLSWEKKDKFDLRDIKFL